MKTLKISTLAIAFAAISLGAKAQTTSSSSSDVRFSVGVDAGVPVGDFGNAYSWNLGGSLQAEIPIAKQLYVTGNVGYNNFFGKKTTVGAFSYTPPDLKIVPLKAGIKIFPTENFYVQGEAGAAFLTNKSDFGYTKSAVFVYAPQIGISYPIGGKNFIDAGIRYESTAAFVDNGKSSAFVGVRLAYGF